MKCSRLGKMFNFVSVHAINSCTQCVFNFKSCRLLVVFCFRRFQGIVEQTESSRLLGKRFHVLNQISSNLVIAKNNISELAQSGAIHKRDKSSNVQLSISFFSFFNRYVTVRFRSNFSISHRVFFLCVTVSRFWSQSFPTIRSSSFFVACFLDACEHVNDATCFACKLHLISSSFILRVSISWHTFNTNVWFFF